jgi:Flp pilus assembly secretin CpaC
MDKYIHQRRLLTIALASMLFTGCTTTHDFKNFTDSKETPKNLIISTAKQEIQLGNFKKASRFLNAGLLAFPKNHELHLLNSVIYYIKSEHGYSTLDLSVAASEAARNLNKNDVASQLMLAFLYLKKNAPTESLELFLTNLEEDYFSTYAATGAIAAYVQMGQINSAIQLNNRFNIFHKDVLKLQTNQLQTNQLQTNENLIINSNIKLDCKNNADNNSANNRTSEANNPADETEKLEPLSLLCTGDNPKNVEISVIIVRTEELLTRSIGVNFLDQLNMILMGSSGREYESSLTDGNESISITSKRSSSIALGSSLSTPGSILYASNIANEGLTHTQVMAQSSIIALDRKPSTLFSGKTLSIGLAGQAGSSNTITDKQIGISLSVTPTVIDSKRALLSVKASRSFIEDISPSIRFAQTLQRRRNSVLMNINAEFNKTYVVAGLHEEEEQKAVSGIPFFKDVPALSYLSSSNDNSLLKRSVLIFLTPSLVNNTPSKANVTNLNIKNERYIHETINKKLQNLIDKIIHPGKSS